jgi:hypothetical protein
MQTIPSASTRTLAAARKLSRVADRIACVTHGSLPRCSLGVLRESKSMSASTMIRTRS